MRTIEYPGFAASPFAGVAQLTMVIREATVSALMPVAGVQTG